MLRYFAFSCAAQDVSLIARARALESRLVQSDPSWRHRFRHAGLSVFTSSPGPGPVEFTLLHGGAGIIVGALFRRPLPGALVEQVKRLDVDETEAVLRTGGGHLVGEYWGSYVSFTARSSPSGHRVLVAPMSSLPCYMASVDGLTLFFSRTEDLVQLDTLSLTVNWDCLLAHVVFKHVCCRETAIAEITEVLPGESVLITDSRIERRTLWNPFRLPEVSPAPEPEPIARQIHATLKTVTHALVSGHDKVLCLLSGGLDSSIVLACLADAPTCPAISCLNQRSSDANGDERYFARLVAEPRHCALLEVERSLDVRLEPMLSAARTANPFHHLLELVAGAPAETWAKAQGATAIFTGTLGDAIFFRRPGRAAVAEYLCRRGLDRGLFRMALWAALLDRASVWQMLMYAVRQSLKLAKRSYWTLREEAERRTSQTSGLLTADATSAVTRSNRFVHPWFHEIDGVSPGKLWQVFLVTVATIDNPLATADSPQTINPLMNQPLSEICLATPAYLHLEGGWDRALARRAFAAELPAAVIQRMSKGGLDDYVTTLFSKNVPFFRELLLDGVLVREGILARQPIEGMLRGGPGKAGASLADLFGYLSKEAWLRSWRG